jgi:hypothetical protein
MRESGGHRLGGSSCVHIERGRGVRSKAMCSFVGGGRGSVVGMLLDRLNLACANE